MPTSCKQALTVYNNHISSTLENLISQKCQGVSKQVKAPVHIFKIQELQEMNIDMSQYWSPKQGKSESYSAIMPESTEGYWGCM